jgi:retinol dehydrogenase 12
VLEIWFAKAFASRLGITSASPIITTVNPGFCVSELRRDVKNIALRVLIAIVVALLARKTEVGSRTLVHGAVGGKGIEDQMRGAYLSVCQVMEPAENVIGEEGERARETYWVKFHLKSMVKC